MSKNFGLPYMGSKNRIAKELITELIWNEPNAQIFIDLFAGGCAMSHAALLSGKYKKVIANDINAMPKLFKDAIKGKYRDEKRWISRDEFHKLKDTDMYVKSCWSFGNDGKSYMYGEHLEPYKKAYHYAKVFGDFSLFNEFAPYIEQELKDELKGKIAIPDITTTNGAAVVDIAATKAGVDITEDNGEAAFKELEKLNSLRDFYNQQNKNRYNNTRYMCYI